MDDKIELNRRMNATLEAMARALFQSWFVDFDPVRAKAAGQTPAGLDPATADLFSSEFEDSALGEIPKGWSVGVLGDIVKLLGGFAFKSKDWVEAGVPVVKIGSVKPGVVDLEQVSFVSESTASEASRFRLRVGDLLIGMTGYVGEVGLVPPAPVMPLLNQRVSKFVLDKVGTEALSFVYSLTRRSEFKAAVISKSHGTAQVNVSGDGILSVAIIVPPKPVRDRFNATMMPTLQKILANHGQSRTLAALRDALLPKLLAGNLQENAIYADKLENN